MGDWLKNNQLKISGIKKTLSIFSISWQNAFIYRFNLLIRQLRTLVSLLAILFFWQVVYLNNTLIGGYNNNLMFTYILGVYLLSELVISSLSIEVGHEIGSGNLTTILLKPVNYFQYWLARDWAHKLINTSIIIIEVFVIVWIFKPPLFISRNLFQLLLLLIIIPIVLFLNFYLNLLVSLLSFWLPEDNGWPQRFLFNTLLMFFAGMYFPFDILPKTLSYLLQFLPTGLILFFPLQILMGRLSYLKILLNIVTALGWLLILIKLNKKIWQLGLKKYSSEGR